MFHRYKKIFHKYIQYRNEINQNGFTHFSVSHINKMVAQIDFLIAKRNRAKKKFIFNNRKFSYLLHPYNYAWRNERTIEVPIIMSYISKYKKGSILEVGNVLNHYSSVNHQVIDKYEVGEGVKNIDIINFFPKKKYSLIVAISTIEHIGFEEIPKDPKKGIFAVDHLKKLLKKDGELVITLPIGYYNPVLNDAISKNTFKFTSRYYLKRHSMSNDWRQVSWEEAKKCKYHTKFPNANAILIGIYNNT